MTPQADPANVVPTPTVAPIGPSGVSPSPADVAAQTAGHDLRILGRTVRHPVEAADIETFPAPAGCDVVVFETRPGEFTSMCPVTQQPDTAIVRITYGPRANCIESKSLKLYLWAWRDRGAFCEAIAAEIADAVWDAATPRWVKVKVEQGVRGGIVTTAIANRPSESAVPREARR